MKKLSRKAKIALGTSLTALTLVPFITVATTSCSYTPKDNKSLETEPKIEHKTAQEDNQLVLKNYNIQFPIEPFSYWENQNNLDQFIFKNLQILNPNLLANKTSYSDIFQAVATRGTSNQNCHIEIKLLNHYKFNRPNNLLTYQMNQTNTSLTFNIKTRAEFYFNQFETILNQTEKTEAISSQNISQTIINAALNSGLDAANIQSASGTFNKLKGTFNDIKIVLNPNQRVGLNDTLNSHLINNNSVISIKTPITTKIKHATEVIFNSLELEKWVSQTNISNLTTENIFNELVKLGIDAKAINKNSIQVQANANNPLIVKISFGLNNGYAFSDDSTSFTSSEWKTLDKLTVYWLSSALAFGTNLVNEIDGTFTKPTVLLDKNNLEKGIDLENSLGFNGISSPVTAETALKSATFKKIFNQFENIPNVENAIKNEISYNFINNINSLFSNLGLVSWSLNEKNTYFVDSLKISPVQNAEMFSLTGKIGFEFFNNLNEVITIPVGAPFFNNKNPMVIQPHQVFGYVYDFNNSTLNNQGSIITPNIVFDNTNIIPGSKTKENPNGTPTGNALFSLKINRGVQYFISGTPNPKAKTYETNNVVTTNNLVSNFYPFTEQTQLIDLELPQVLNKGNVDYFTYQNEFNNYLGSLSSNIIKEQLIKQDHAIWNFVLGISHSVQMILDSFANNDTISQFLYNLQVPIESIITQLTREPQLAKVISGLFSNIPLAQYLNQNKEYAKQTFKWLLELVAKNPELYKIIYNKVISHIPVKIFSDNPFGTSLMVERTETIPQQFSNIFNELTSSKKMWEFLNNVWKLASKESLIEILGTQVQNFLDVVLETSVKSKNTAAYQLLLSISKLLVTLETDQNTNNIGGLRIIDFLQNKKQSDVLLNFAKNTLVTFLEAISPDTAKIFKEKYLPLIELMLTVYYDLHFNHINQLFYIIGHPYVNGKPETLEYVLKNCVDFTPTVTDISYNPSTHIVNFKNELNFTFKENVSLDMQAILNYIGNNTLGDIYEIINQQMHLGLKRGFSTSDFLHRLMEIYHFKNANVDQLIWCFYLNDPDNMINTKLKDIFAGIQFKFTRGESITFNTLAENRQVFATVRYSKITWWTNTISIVTFNIKQFLDNLLTPIFKWFENWFYHNEQHPWYEAFFPFWIYWRVANAIKSIGEQIIARLGEVTYNFIGGWVNQIHLLNFPKVYNYTSDVQNSNYYISVNTDRNRILTEIYNLLRKNASLGSRGELRSFNQAGQSFPYFSNSSAFSSGNGNSLGWQIYRLIVDQNNLPLNYLLNPEFMPAVVIQYRKPIVFGIPINIIGSINFWIHETIPGSYTVALKFPIKLPVTYDNGKTYKMEDTISFTYSFSDPL